MVPPKKEKGENNQGEEDASPLIFGKGESAMANAVKLSPVGPFLCRNGRSRRVHKSKKKRKTKSATFRGFPMPKKLQHYFIKFPVVST